MYPTCAVPGCGVPFSGCDIHHVHPWEEGGNTDLGELLPVCWRHHDAVHRGGWRLTLDPVTRFLTITKPDGSVMTHGPPYCGRR